MAPGAGMLPYGDQEEASPHMVSEIVTVLRRLDNCEDGSINAQELAGVLHELGGAAMTTEKADMLIMGAGGLKGGRVPIQTLIEWIFCGGSQNEVPKTRSVSMRHKARRPSAVIAPQRPSIEKAKVVPEQANVQQPEQIEQQEQRIEEEPTSPKFQGTRSKRERRASAYMVEQGEELFFPENHCVGILLIRPAGTFAYAHEGSAKFSEGVSGDWSKTAGMEDAIDLLPKNFGRCYEDVVKERNITGMRLTIIPRRSQVDENGRFLCTLSDELRSRFTWIDPASDVASDTERVPGVGAPEQLGEPVSPKVPSRRKQKTGGASGRREKRAYAYRPAEKERLLCLESYSAGSLLLRPSGHFSYVHDGSARFSDGMIGNWLSLPSNRVELEPTSIGWCYKGNLEEREVLGNKITVLIHEDRFDASGREVCVLPEELLQIHNWLYPADYDFGDAASQEEEEPMSPKIQVRKREVEKQACRYAPTLGEELYCPVSRPDGMLLLRPDHSFAYVHDNKARFSEGVQGKWREEHDGHVELRPSSFGWCYKDSFDESEIVNSCHSVHVHRGETNNQARMLCSFPEELTQRLSWLDPSLPERRS